MFSIITVLLTNQTDISKTLCCLLERYCRQIKQTYHRHYVFYHNGIVDKSNGPIIDNMFSILTVLQTNKTDISQTICSVLSRYCRQIKQTYHRQYVLYQNGIADKSNTPIINNMFSIITYCRQIKKTNHRQYVVGCLDKIEQRQKYIQ